MHESFLHYVWQFQYFDKSKIKTDEEERLLVFNPGMLNTDAGPDFLNAKIRMNEMEWSGSVEIHTKSSEWENHKHSKDAAYDNVILHVVWIDDRKVFRSDGSPIPTLELKGRIEESLIRNYRSLVNSPALIPCANHFKDVPDLLKVSMIDKALSLRLEQKSDEVLKHLKSNKNDWEETTYQLLARSFGFKVNNESFSALAKAIPLKILLKHFSSPLQIEALLFGQAGFLEEPVKDEYSKSLQREYKVLAKKYDLEKNRINKSQWKFLRLRPGNFPTLRIAQLAALIYSHRNIFSKFLETEDASSLNKIFETSPSVYWKTHYQFEKKAKQTVPPLGSSSIDNLIINVVVPLWIAYGLQKDLQNFMDRSINVLQQLSAEQNAITKRWKVLGLKSKNAHDSQALIEQYNNFCKRRKCLQCVIGNSLLKS